MQAKILRKEYFCHSRFCLVKFQTRFGTIEFQITDAETVSDAQVKAGELPEMVYQGDERGAHKYMLAHE